MKSHYRVVVIGGGIVGASLLYHLTLRGWTDVAIIERSELTAGSSWHAAGGFHAINSDTHIAALQKYTIGMYPQVEAESGQVVGLKMSGGIELASTPDRWEWLQAELEWHHMMGTEGARLVDVDEIMRLVPIVEPTGIIGGLLDPYEGNLDPHGATHAYATAARNRGADVVLHNRVLSMSRENGLWQLITEEGRVTAEHVVNAAGLWARKVGRMVGVDHPVTPMQHHYLVTESIPEVAALTHVMPAVTDLEGFTYLQREQDGVLLGVYERNPRHWMTEGAEWDFGMTLLPEEVERISPELEIGLRRFPALAEAGIKKWVNGAFTFTPDGNPLVGPVRGVPGYWAACGVMAGFSQCAAIGLALSNWMVDGDPGDDVFAMDVARFGPWASDDSYLLPTTSQFYSRRFLIAYPNEFLPAARPLHTTPAYDELVADGGRFNATWGLEVPQYFTPGEPDFVEVPSLRRSNAFGFVAAEVAAVRTAVGAYETGVYARYEVSGPQALEWLDQLLACRIPEVGRVRLAPILHPKGTLMGDLTVSRLGDDRFWLVGSYYLQEWHQRWFEKTLPSKGVTIDNLTGRWLGFAISGPNSRELLSRVVEGDVSTEALPFMSIRPLSVLGTPGVVARLSLTGELGYEITVASDVHADLWRALRSAGVDLGLRPVGDRAIDSLRLEKGYGIWSTEFTQAYTPGMSGLDRFVAFDKGEFVGREAAERERAEGSSRRLVLLDVDVVDADAAGDEPVWCGDEVVGFVTSGSYGHHVQRSLALAYVDAHVADDAHLLVSVIGQRRPARILPEVPYDPSGSLLRG
ncbi:MAG: FAD-dependent oxidoreductase [Actinomycetes bacterium]